MIRKVVEEPGFLEDEFISAVFKRSRYGLRGSWLDLLPAKLASMVIVKSSTDPRKNPLLGTRELDSVLLTFPTNTDDHRRRYFKLTLMGLRP